MNPSPSLTKGLVGLLRTLLHVTRNMLRLFFTLAITAYAASVGFTGALFLLLPISSDGYSAASDLQPAAQLIAMIIVIFAGVVLPWLLACYACLMMWLLQERFHVQILPRLMSDSSLRQSLELPVYGISLAAMSALATAAGFDANNPYQDFSFSNPWLLTDISELPGLVAQTAWHYMGSSAPMTLFFVIVSTVNDGDGGGWLLEQNHHAHGLDHHQYERWRWRRG